MTPKQRASREHFWQALLRAYADLFITWEEVDEALRKADREQNWGDDEMNIESKYNATMAEASRVYREATVDAFAMYVHDCELAGKRYAVSTGDVLVAQDVCRREIDVAGDRYDDAVIVQLEAYVKARDAAREAYRFSENCP